MSQLEGQAHRAEDLEKANIDLVAELTALRKQVDRLRADAIVEFQTSQPYFDELRVQYGNEIKDFCKQMTIFFPSVDFSQV